MLPVSLSDEREIRLRSPGYWLGSIRGPVFVFEGDHDANTDQDELLRESSKNPKAQFFVVPRADHFSVLAPTTELIAKKILADTGAQTTIGFSEAELEGLLKLASRLVERRSLTTGTSATTALDRDVESCGPCRFECRG
jgi:hypothetical protein